MVDTHLLAVWKNTHVGLLLSVLEQEINKRSARVAVEREWNVHARAEWLRQSIVAHEAEYADELTAYPFDDLLSELDRFVDIDLTFPYMARQDMFDTMRESLRVLHTRYMTLLCRANPRAYHSGMFDELEARLSAQFDDTVAEWQTIANHYQRLDSCRERCYIDLANGHPADASQRITMALHPAAG